MASGRLGAADLAAITNTLLYTVPVLTVATVNVNVCNRNAVATTIRIAHLDGAIGTLANEDYVVYDFSVPANIFFELRGIVMSAASTIVAYAGNTGISVQVWGWEEAS